MNKVRAEIHPRIDDWHYILDTLSTIGMEYPDIVRWLTCKPTLDDAVAAVDRIRSAGHF